MANGKFYGAAKRDARLVGFEIIRDTVEIDESLHADDSISIEDCFGFVLIEVCRDLVGSLTPEEIVARAAELADQSKPYGVEFLSWKIEHEGNFIRFTVDQWEAISQEERDQDNADAKAEDRFEAAREARLG